MATDETRSRSAELEAEGRCRALIDAAHNVIICLDPEGRILEWNRAAERLYRWRRDQVLGESYLERFLPREARAAVSEDIARVLSGETTVGFENAVETRDGERWLSWNVSRLLRPDGEAWGIVAVGQDVTDRRRADRRLADYQQRLRSLAAEAALIEERERRRLADELHDHIGQTLGVAGLKLATLRRTPMPDRLAAELDEVAGLIEGASRDVRSLLFEISPPVFWDLGFAAAAEWLVERQQAPGTRFDLVDDGKPKPLAEAHGLILFRAVRELLLNVVKHARARRCTVSLERRGDEMRIEVADDGVGFAPEVLEGAQGGYGLFSIREQLGRLGGRLEVGSRAGEGSRVLLWAPLDLGEDRAAAAAEP